MERRPNIYVEAHGCAANMGDYEIIRSALENAGCKIVSEIGKADFLILLTCIVINTTEQRMLSRLKEFAKTGKKIIVAGCMAAARKEEAQKIIPDIIFVKPSETGTIAKIICGECAENFESKLDVPIKHRGIQSIIQISEGCASACTYCITKKARGKLVSFDPEKIVGCARRAVESGCKELLITAQDTGDYGKDLGHLRLPQLLRKIAEIPGDFKIRVGMMGIRGAKQILGDLIQIYKNEKIYKFIHLPVQSGDDEILRLMGRGYKAADFEKIVEKLRKDFPEILISTDIIVGFPGETEEQFENTLGLLRKARPEIINIKRFSSRPGTKAHKMDGKIHTKIMKARSTKATALHHHIGAELGKRYVGKEFGALVTEEGKDNSSFARLDNYKAVAIKDRIPIGTRIRVKIKSATYAYLVGEIVE